MGPHARHARQGTAARTASGARRQARACTRRGRHAAQQARARTRHGMGQVRGTAGGTYAARQARRRGGHSRRLQRRPGRVLCVSPGPSRASCRSRLAPSNGRLPRGNSRGQPSTQGDAPPTGGFARTDPCGHLHPTSHTAPITPPRRVQRRGVRRGVQQGSTAGTEGCSGVRCSGGGAARGAACHGGVRRRGVRPGVRRRGVRRGCGVAGCGVWRAAGVRRDAVWRRCAVAGCSRVRRVVAGGGGRGGGAAGWWRVWWVRMELGLVRGAVLVGLVSRSVGLRARRWVSGRSWSRRRRVSVPRAI